MARTRQRDLLDRLAGAGEDAISRMAGSQATARVLETMNGMRDKVEELQKRVTGLDNLEKRVAKLEKALADQSKPKTTRSRSASGTAARKKTTPSRPATRKKPSS